MASSAPSSLRHSLLCSRNPSTSSFLARFHALPRHHVTPVIRTSPHSTPTTARQMSSTPQLRSLNIDNINPNVKQAQYAVRGELAVRSEKYRQKLKGADGGGDNLPFKSVISANIGNPQQLDQKPLTFLRQVASLLENPKLLDKEKVLVEHLDYKEDVIERARWLLKDVNSVGAYSQSQGAQGVREHVAQFISDRDGHKADAADIYLSNGASGAVNTLLHIIVQSKSTGVLVPIPQYPLYTATLSLLDAQCVPYYLDESSNWSTNVKAIEEALEKARKDGTDVRAIVVINPGNPTGGVLNADEMAEIVKLAAKEKLVLIGDEVYQQNIFEGKFTSFKKVLRDLQAGPDGADYENVELASLHSISKGMTGECGHRGGYMELIGFDPKVVAEIYKFVSISLCAPVVGQCLVECMVNPPKPGEPSYELFKEEYDGIYNGMKDRAMALYEAFQEMEGVECQKPQGSMYLFPQIKLPKKAHEQAEKEGRQPDGFYVSAMLDATGVCMVPGGGFGQADGTSHFRTTFLPPGTEWVERLKKFHADFMKEFGDK